MKEELTTEMHSEFVVSKDKEVKLRAGCVWGMCKTNDTESNVRYWCSMYNVKYDDAIKWKVYWKVMQAKGNNA